MTSKPVATRQNVFATADELSKNGSAQAVTVTDLRRRLRDPNGRLEGFFAEWRAKRIGGLPPELVNALDGVWRAAQRNQGDGPRPEATAVRPVRDEPEVRRRGRPPAAPRPRPHEGSFLATCAAEEAEEAEARRARRARLRPDRGGKGPEGLAENAADLATASGRLRAAIGGAPRPGAPKRRRVSPADWKTATNKVYAREVAKELCDLGRPMRTMEIYEFLCRKFDAWSPKPEYIVSGILEGSRIVRKRGEWWFEGEERPPRVPAGERIEDLYLAAAIETLRNEGRLMTAPEIEARFADAKALLRKGWLADALRRAVERSDVIEKSGEAYRWIGPDRTAGP